MSDTASTPPRRRRFWRGRPAWLWLMLGLVAGLIAFAAFRMATFKESHTHYHANFALYIDGGRFEFKDPGYYEELATCDVSNHSPQHRAHMHKPDNDVVHVHEAGATWGGFLANLGITASPYHLQIDDKLFPANAAKTVRFILNGHEIQSINTTVIADQDRLLISYGDQTAERRMDQFKSVGTSAKEIDNSSDPAACSGAEDHGWWARVQHIWE